MVMHARKYQRLNDGYYERGQAQPYPEDKNSTRHRHYNDRYGEKSRDSPSYKYSSSTDGRRDRETSPSRSNDRYQNKASYMDRKDKGNMADKRSNHDRSQPGKDGGRNREQKQRDHKAEVRKSAVRVCGDWSEHISSSSKCYYYNCKTEVSRWEKPKDWNDKMAVKTPSSKSKDVKDRRQQPQHSHPAKKYDDRGKHSASATVTSTSSEVHRDSQSTSRSTFSSPSASRHQYDHANSNSDHKYRQSHNANNTHWSGPEHVEQSYSTPERPSKTYESVGNNGGLHPARSKHGRTAAQPTDYNGSGSHARNDYAGTDSRQAEDMDISPGSTPTEESMLERSIGTGGLPPVVTGTPPSAARPTPVTPSALAVLSSLPNMPDLSMLANFSPLSPGGTTGISTTFLSQLLQQLASQIRNTQAHSQSNQQATLRQAIQVLQQLQQTLLMQQKQQQQRQLQQLLVTQLQQLQQQLQTQQTPPKQQSDQNDGQNSRTHKDESDGTPLQSPEQVGSLAALASHMGQDRSRADSPPSEHSRHSDRRGSPTPSHSSCQNVSTVSTSQLSAAHRKHDSVHLSKSLAQYYDEKLISHVSGLIYDHTEKQSDLVAEEAHTVGSIMCTQVSADLKGARSLVRAGEIISTLYEQRLSFIRQQIKDLDNWRTQNTFMPSSSANSKPPADDT